MMVKVRSFSVVLRSSKPWRSWSTRNCLVASESDIQLIMDLLRYARIKSATLQIEHHSYLTQCLLVNFARENGIAVTAYSSFTNTSFLKLNMQIARNARPLLSHPVITPVSRMHDRTSAQVVLRWATQQGIAVILKSNSETRLLENLRVNDFGLEQNEIDGISALNRNLRFNNPLNVSRNYPRAVIVY